jgi:hypothetical protein
MFRNLKNFGGSLAWGLEPLQGKKEGNFCLASISSESVQSGQQIIPRTFEGPLQSEEYRKRSPKLSLFDFL